LLANLVRSRIGRTWRAVRDQEVAAELAGINLGAWRVLAFVVSAACAGLAGAVLALVVRLAAPSGFTLVLSLALLTAIVIGGLGSLLGALVGSAVLVFLPPYVTELGGNFGLDQTEAAQLSPFVYGVVLIVAMIFAPAGLVGTIRLRWLSARARRAGAGG
jgi:branched-chain amino acid transport system permease protein